jgi:hypothetical protein
VLGMLRLAFPIFLHFFRHFETLEQYVRMCCRDARKHGCQMVYFQNKHSVNVGKFLRALDWKILIYFMDIWNICGHL